MGDRHGRAAAVRQATDGSGGGDQISVDVVEQAVLVPLGQPLRVDVREVGTPSAVVVGGEVAQEVDLLERGAQATSAHRQLVVPLLLLSRR